MQPELNRLPTIQLEEETLSQSMEVGTVLGGRYRIATHVLNSAEGDQVFDGVDQVLNRPVSIVVAGHGNGDNLTQGAREVATGDRPANFQILDLGLGDGTAYLIASKSGAADLLDLLIPTEPFVEPSFTDTLGEELFGGPRAEEPVAAEYVYDDGTPVPASVIPPAAVPPPPVIAPRSSDPVPSAKEPVLPTATKGQPVQAADSGSVGSPKVSLWSDEDYGFINEKPAVSNDQRKPSTFPASAVAAAPLYQEPPRNTSAQPIAGGAIAAGAGSSAGSGPGNPNADYDDEVNAPRSGRWLILGILAIVVVVAIVFAGTQLLTSWFGDKNPAAQSSASNSQSSSEPNSSNSPQPSNQAGPPVVVGATREVPGASEADLAKNFPEGLLANLTDGNPATLWSSYEFTDETMAGTSAKSIALIVQLKDRSTVSSVAIAQSGTSGGSFEVLVNDKPSLDGAKSIGTGIFTGPEFNISAPPNTTASYVIVNFTKLPKVLSPQIYPYGLKIGEITIK